MDDATGSFRFGRRQFLKGAALGGGVLLASATGMVSLGDLAAAAAPRRGEASAAGGTGPLVFAAEVDQTGTLASLVKIWNANNTDTPVTYQTIPAVTNTVYQQYVTALAGGSATPDVLTMDVTYIGTFAKAGWISPLTPFVDKILVDQYTPTSIALGTYDKKLYALQQYLDCGQLYYRTDLVKKYKVDVPTTYAELVAAAEKIQAGERKRNSSFYGFVFEGAQIEAMFDQFDEYVWGYGGDVVSGKKVTLQTRYGRDALGFMHDAIYKHQISPTGESTMNPTAALTVMQNGDSAFMRNWGFAYANLENAAQSKVKGLVQNTTLPGAQGPGHGCTGGWMFGINAHTPRQLAAWRFIRFLTSKQVQATIAVGMGVVPGQQSVLTERAVIKHAPNLAQMPVILSTARNRPSIADYPAVSALVQAPFNGVVANQTSISDALTTAQNAVASAVVA